MGWEGSDFFTCVGCGAISSRVAGGTCYNCVDRATRRVNPRPSIERCGRCGQHRSAHDGSTEPRWLCRCKPAPEADAKQDATLEWLLVDWCENNAAGHDARIVDVQRVGSAVLYGVGCRGCDEDWYVAGYADLATINATPCPKSKWNDPPADAVLRDPPEEETPLPRTIPEHDTTCRVCGAPATTLLTTVQCSAGEACREPDPMDGIEVSGEMEIWCMSHTAEPCWIAKLGHDDFSRVPHAIAATREAAIAALLKRLGRDPA